MSSRMIRGISLGPSKTARRPAEGARVKGREERRWAADGASLPADTRYFLCPHPMVLSLGILAGHRFT